MSRREQLESMFADSPKDTFLRYALAMELDSEEEHEKSLEMHRELINDDPPYVPSFFMSGQQLAKLDRIRQLDKVGSRLEVNLVGDRKAGTQWESR